MKKKYQLFIKKYFNKPFFNKLVFDPTYLNVTCYLLLIVEVLLNVFIIEKVKYTEIDWIAYMQEVEGFLNGTLDYKELKGDTGPLVYPAGFVYIYSILYYVTSRGTNIHLAQYVFLVFYIMQLWLSFEIYKKTAKVPPYALVLSTLTSYRIHSLFVLRLFNDPIAVLLFYISFHLFMNNKWKLGSVFYSLAVSVKMNILLYSPCLLTAYLTNLGFREVFINLSICGIVQLILGLPFLLSNPVSYIKGSFDLGRVFEHKWTVNYRFLTKETFENRYFHIALLSLHIFLLLVFLPSMKKYLSSYSKLYHVIGDIKTQVSKGVNEKTKDSFSKVARLFVLPFFVTNLIGIACARSLHYQFYSWYFHSLLYLAFSTGYRKPVIFLILGVIELCWNTYPSTDVSSVTLHLCHILLIYGVYKTMKL